jgi:hypothetical protein
VCDTACSASLTSTLATQKSDRWYLLVSTIIIYIIIIHYIQYNHNMIDNDRHSTYIFFQPYLDDDHSISGH